MRAPVLAAWLILAPACAHGPAAAGSSADDGRIECRRLVESYAIARDQVDATRYAALFAPDAELVLGSRRAIGPAAITALMVQRAAGTVTRHLMSTASFTAQDDGTVHGVSYFIVYSARPADANARPIAAERYRAVIEYHDVCARTDAGWRLRRREIRPIFVPPPAAAGPARAFRSAAAVTVPQPNGAVDAGSRAAFGGGRFKPPEAL